MLKRCAKCLEEKPTSEFNKRGKNLLYTICKSCYAIKRKFARPSLTETEFQKERRINHEQGLQRCSSCKIVKPRSDFSNRKDARRGIASSCKVCRNAIQRAARKDGMRYCPQCETVKKNEEFYSKRMGSNLSTYCKICARARTALWMKSPSGILRSRANGRKYQTGFTEQLWNIATRIQGNCCAICLKNLSSLSRTPHADHNHQSKIPRGILCHKCNTAIGLLEDNPRLCRAAADYLDDPPLSLIV